jgi:hypothetical protein
MKKLLIITTLITTLASTHAQERSSREEALKYAFFISLNLKEMLNTPIATDPDVKRPVALKDGDYGGMSFPETKLSPDTFAKAGKEVVPVGQLWMRKLSPLVNGQVVPVGKLKMVHVAVGDQEGDVAHCALGAQKTADGGFELLVYGKTKEPIARVPLKPISGTQENPLEMSAERQGDGGLLTLKFAGKYQAELTVTDPEQ